MKMVPNIKEVAVENRAFLRRAVQFCLRQGIRQFLDLGSGIPTVGNVHEIAQRSPPEARGIYVDNETVPVTHSRTILEDNDNAEILHADLADVEGVLNALETQCLIDFDEPVTMMMTLLHFIPDSAEPRKIIQSYADRMAPGSHLCMSHVTADDSPESVRGLCALYENTFNPGTLRSRAEFTDLFLDFTLYRAECGLRARMASELSRGRRR